MKSKFENNKKTKKDHKKANWDKFFEVLKALVLLVVEILRRI